MTPTAAPDADPPDFDRARACFMAGVAAFEAGALADAEAQFAASLALLPGRASTLMNLGAVRVARGQPAEALPMLDAALAQEPGSTDVLGHRAAALTALGRHADALAVYETLAAARPADPAPLFHQGMLLQALGRPLQALNCYERLLALDSGSAAAWSQRGGILRDMGQHPQAAACYRQALAHGGDAVMNGYFLAAVTDVTSPPPAAPRPYVEGLFDGYADDYEQHLVGQLGYRIPALLAALLPDSRHYDSALDLGCGTGLMAPLLRPRCAALDGVDLSARMLAQARAGGRYRRLQHADLAEHLAGCGERYGLVVAADVFIYVGALDAVFAGVARVLQPGGDFVFSVETADAGLGLQLRPSARYAHGERALRVLAQEHGLAVQRCEAATLRHEQRQPIAGLLMRLARAG